MQTVQTQAFTPASDARVTDGPAARNQRVLRPLVMAAIALLAAIAGYAAFQS
jgi:hypothetical protein